MKTRSNSSNSTSDGNTAVDSLESATWTDEDEVTLLDFLYDRKNRMVEGSRSKFEPDVWNAAAPYMTSRVTKGGQKTARRCREKWDRVSISFYPHL